MPNGTILGVDATGALKYYSSIDLNNADAWKPAPSAVAVRAVRSLMNGSIVGIKKLDGALVHRCACGPACWAGALERLERRWSRAGSGAHAAARCWPCSVLTGRCAWLAGAGMPCCCARSTTDMPLSVSVCRCLQAQPLGRVVGTHPDLLLPHQPSAYVHRLAGRPAGERAAVLAPRPYTPLSRQPTLTSPQLHVA